MKLHLLLLIFLFSSFSCSKKKLDAYEYIIFGSEAAARLAYDIQSENDSIISFLKAKKPSEKLLIGGVRNESLREINELKSKLIEYCGGRNPETYELINPLEQEKVTEFFIESDNGADLKNTINKICAFIKKYNKDETNIAFDANEIKHFENAPWAEKSFVELHFDNSTLVSALNTLVVYEGFIVQRKNGFLNKILME